MERVFGISRATVMRWFWPAVKGLPLLIDTLLPAQPGEVLEWGEPIKQFCLPTAIRWWTKPAMSAIA